MTFTEIVTEITAHLNLTSTEASTRVGRLVNMRYREILSSLGLDTSVRATVTGTATSGQATITFTSINKILRVSETTGGIVQPLKEVSWEELREKKLPSSDSVSQYAIQTVGADSVVVLFDVTFASTTPTFRADGYAPVATISSTTEPVFPENFHDILFKQVVSDELMKMEKKADAAKWAADAEKRMSQLRLYLAKTIYLDRRQGSRESSWPF